MNCQKLIIVMVVTSLLAGCAGGMTQVQKKTALGTGVGAAVGAGLGQIFGGNTQSTLIGAALGGLAGGIFTGYTAKQEEELRNEVSQLEGVAMERDNQILSLTFNSSLMFDVDSAQIKPAGVADLQRVAAVLVRYPENRLKVVGHTDSTGSDAHNLELSQRRADAVRDLLLASGVAAGQVIAVGQGASLPVASNDTEAGRQQNRRVTIAILPNAADQQREQV